MIYLITTKYNSNISECLKSDDFKMMSWGDALASLHSSSFLNIDLETTGFDFISQKILTAQLSNDGVDQYVFIINEPEEVPQLFPVLDSCTMLVGHNIKFDLKFLYAHGYDIHVPIYDTMLCEQVLTNGTQMRAGLDAVVQRYCQVNLDKSVRESFSHVSALSERQLRYAADDVKYLEQVRLAQTYALREKSLLQVAKLECEASLAFAAIEFNGLRLDTKAWDAIVDELKDQAVAATRELNTIISTDDKFASLRERSVRQIDMFSSYTDNALYRINWDSTSQVLKVFHCIDKSLMSTSDREIQIIARKHPLGAALKHYRHVQKLASSYGVDFYKHVKDTGKIHPNFRQIVRTGRVSCSEPNVQQIPADNKYRNAFIADSPDEVFVSADYSSQELCIIAHGSQDPVFLEALENGHDLHSVCATLVFGDEWVDAAEEDCTFMSHKAKCSCPRHKELRNAVKAINFGLAYGMGPAKLSDNLNISVKQASELIEQYFTKFPAIRQFLESNARFGVRNGYIQTYAPWHRVRYFDDWLPGRMEMATKSRIERVSKNTPIQGTAADMTKHALTLCYSHIKTNDLPVRLVMTVHDQIDTICRRDYAETWAAKLKELMEQAATHIMGNELLKAEVEITDKWSK
jgi:DNA polymerase-1